MSGLSGEFVPRLELSRVAEEIYGALGPYTEVDADNGLAMRWFVSALCKMFEDVDELVRDSLLGEQGWSEMFDPTRVPPEGMAWLGQLLGVRIPPSADEAIARAMLVTPAGIHRGTRPAMEGAIAPLLIGNKTVYFFERDTSAYHIAIRTRTTETPDPAAVLAALIANKPAGLVLDYATFAGVLYLETSGAFATYAATSAAKATYALRSLP